MGAQAWTDERPRVGGPPPVEVPFDQARSDAFRARLREGLERAALVLMTGLGHRTGLFDALAWAPGASASDLAELVGLDEAWVGGWLEVMVAADVVRSEGPGRHALPAEHSAHLTRAAAEENLAGEAAWILRAASEIPRRG